MEISDVKKRVFETIERAKRAAGERRTRMDEAAREFDVFLNQVAVPLFRQIAAVLKAEGRPFTVFTPSGSVRLMSDRSNDDYIELTLDSSDQHPQVIGHTSRGRGRRVTASETPLGHGGPVRTLTEEDVLAFVMKELEPLVER
ncbi:MAG: hypothetical protein ABI868_24710 [Acidobacteriota bacterium]